MFHSRCPLAPDAKGLGNDEVLVPLDLASLIQGEGPRFHTVKSLKIGPTLR
jgi:hypothetical protein